MKLQTFQQVLDIAGESELRALLRVGHRGAFAAYWLVAEAPILAMLLNGDQACLFYTPPGGDDLESFNQTCADPEATVPFLIENYQCDDMPAEIVIPRLLAEEAFVEFYRSRRLHPGVTWR